MNQEELQAAVDAVPYWYHRIDLPHGITTPGWAPLDPSVYRIPEDMTGAVVLDVGAWDGYWTFEAIRRGAIHADVIDDFSDTIGKDTNADRTHKWTTLRLCSAALGFNEDCYETLTNPSGQTVDFFTVDIQQKCSLEFSNNIGNARYTNVFAFGLIYHLQHPMLALQNIRALLLPGGTLHIETAILDGCRSSYGDYGYSGDECCFEFFPGDEYGMNQSNWWVGTLRAWCGLVEAAGFRYIESWKLTDKPEHLSQSRGFIRAKV